MTDIWRCISCDFQTQKPSNKCSQHPSSELVPALIWDKIQEGIEENRKADDRLEEKERRRFLIEQASQAPEDRAAYIRATLYGVTTHIPDWKDLHDTVGAIGDGYCIVRKVLLYGALGLLYRGIVTLNDIKTDCRINALVILPSGRGKKHIRNFKHLLNVHFGKLFSEPSSFHPEQYIGKMVWRKLRNDDIVSPGGQTVLDKDGRKLLARGKKGKTNLPEEVLDEAEGYLRDDEHLIEEGSPLLQGEISENRQTFAILCKATDTIGENVIAKKLVDQKRDEGLSYPPETQVTICVQPFPIKAELVLNGLFRRFVTIYPDLPEEVPAEELERRSGERTMSQAATKRLLDKFSSIHVWLKEKNPKIQLEPALLPLFNTMVEEIRSFARFHSPKARSYASIIPYDCQNQLLKFAALQAVYRRNGTIGEVELRTAYIDLLEFYASAFRFLDQKVSGSVDYGVSLRQTAKKEREHRLLEWLWLELADSQETTKTTVLEALYYLQQDPNISERTAERTLKDLEDVGQISRLTGPGVSKIWLGKEFKPTEIDRSEFEFRVYKESVALMASVAPVKPTDDTDATRISMPYQNNTPKIVSNSCSGILPPSITLDAPQKTEEKEVEVKPS